MNEIYSKWKHDFINLLTLPNLRITNDGILWKIKKSYKIKGHTRKEAFEYYDNGILKTAIFWKDDKLNNPHRHIPADYGYSNDGKLLFIEYAKKGILSNIR